MRSSALFFATLLSCSTALAEDLHPWSPNGGATLKSGWGLSLQAQTAPVEALNSDDGHGWGELWVSLCLSLSRSVDLSFGAHGSFPVAGGGHAKLRVLVDQNERRETSLEFAGSVGAMLSNMYYESPSYGTPIVASAQGGIVSSYFKDRHELILGVVLLYQYQHVIGDWHSLALVGRIGYGFHATPTAGFYVQVEAGSPSWPVFDTLPETPFFFFLPVVRLALGAHF